MHDALLAVNDMISFIKHIMRDAQQKKAKSESFSLLNDESCFWLKDYAQKILPLKFWEGQKDYFRKKGMSMHIDVFFLKKGLDISKQVYLTVIYRCDQGMANTLSICENVLKEFKKTNPTITNIFTKFDNAGSYHGNCIFEGLFKVCKHAGFQLMRTDYNEPCSGKDQCDQESTTAKNIINSFVDAGNDMMTAEDVYKALHYGNGMQDTKDCVLQIDVNNTSLSGEAIRNVSYYHSVKYFKEDMLLWWYFESGEGVRHVYNNVHFKSSHNIILPFSTTDKRGSGKTITNELTVQPDRQLCSLFFRQEIDCSASFENASEFELHMVAGVHQCPKLISSMDRVKNAFVTKMKSSSQLHLPLSSDEVNIANMSLEDPDQCFPIMGKLQE